jgi:glycine/D-amino acid oxidase-like deaminating enzyme
MTKEVRVAVLGAGIMGSSVALFLSRRGARVVLFDAAQAPFSGASRWNEGKIHLGYLYARDASMETARAVLPGGLVFKALTEELIGCSLDPAVTVEDDLFLLHRDSVVSVDQTQHYFETLTKLLRAHPQANQYLVSLSDTSVRPLSAVELDAVTDTRLVRAGFRVSERSVRTSWVADRFVDALGAEAGIEMALGRRVRSLRAGQTRWTVETDGGDEDGFDFVVNALWQGRIQMDRTVGMEPEPGWSHRYRLSLFVKTARPVAAPNAVISTGPFGDIKSYTARDFYLSWYPAGLVAQGEAMIPPPVPGFDENARRAIVQAIGVGLGALIPSAATVLAEAAETRLEGGWVFANGNGSLADPHATLHRRDRFGIRQAGTYISVDTGKYSTAPWLARNVALMITGE